MRRTYTLHESQSTVRLEGRVTPKSFALTEPHKRKEEEIAVVLLTAEDLNFFFKPIIRK